MAQTYDHLIYGTDGADTLSDDLIPAGETVWIIGKLGDDTLSTTGPDNRIAGGGGNDTITSLGGLVGGGYGDDTIHMAGAGGKIVGGAGNDTITIGDIVSSNYYAVTIWGDNPSADGAGNDIITGSDVRERVYDGAGDDIVDLKKDGLIFANVLPPADPDLSDDDIYIGSTLPGDTQERLSYARSEFGITVQINNDVDPAAVGTAQGLSIGNDQIIGIDNIVTGTDDDSVFITTSGSFVLHTKQGNDFVQLSAPEAVIRTGGGDDFVSAGNGTILIDGGTGTNSIVCNAGQQTIAFQFEGLGNSAVMKIGVQRFEPGIDKILLDSGTNVADFLASGHDGSIAGTPSVIFDISPTKLLALADITIDQLSIGDFLT